MKIYTCIYFQKNGIRITTRFPYLMLLKGLLTKKGLFHKEKESHLKRKIKKGKEEICKERKVRHPLNRKVQKYEFLILDLELNSLYNFAKQDVFRK